MNLQVLRCKNSQISYVLSFIWKSPQVYNQVKARIWNVTTHPPDNIGITFKSLLSDFCFSETSVTTVLCVHENQRGPNTIDRVFRSSATCCITLTVTHYYWVCIHLKVFNARVNLLKLEGTRCIFFSPPWNGCNLHLSSTYRALMTNDNED